MAKSVFDQPDKRFEKMPGKRANWRGRAALCCLCEEPFNGKHKPIDKAFMVNDSVWTEEANLSPDAGWAGLSCFELRIGRELALEDFSQYFDAPINFELLRRRFGIDDQWLAIHKFVKAYGPGLAKIWSEGDNSNLSTYPFCEAALLDSASKDFWRYVEKAGVEAAVQGFQAVHSAGHSLYSDILMISIENIWEGFAGYLRNPYPATKAG